MDAALLSQAKMSVTAMDTDKNGTVSLKEFLATPTRHFEEMDANKDGQVTAEELLAFHKKKVAEAEKAHAAMSMATQLKAAPASNALGQPAAK